jgi:hypothetical protein
MGDQLIDWRTALKSDMLSFCSNHFQGIRNNNIMQLLETSLLACAFVKKLRFIVRDLQHSFALQQQAPASNLEPTAPASIPASEEVPPPLPASPPPTEVETASITDPQKVEEVIAEVESIPAEPKDTTDIPVQLTSPLATPKDVVKIEQPLTPDPVEEPKTEDTGVPKPVEAQEPALVMEEKTEAPIQAVEPVPQVPQIEDEVSAPTETPAQVIGHK